jgi:hypothetical protein
MMKKLQKWYWLSFFVLVGFAANAQKAAVKVGTNPTTINASAVLEAESTSKGFLPPRMTTVQRDAIVSPATGLTIYNKDTNCTEVYNGVYWYNICGNNPAVVSGYDCSIAATGSLSLGIAANATQTIRATVSRVGNYSISATTNGVTFSGTGVFTSTGPQDVVLVASGTPTTLGNNTFVLNTTPSCSFNWNVTNGSSNGTAVVSSYSCSTASAGNLIVGQVASGVSQTITATVATAGTYAISTTGNGITFAGSGTFAGTGAQNIVLTASGTPILEGPFTYNLNTTPACSFSRSSVVMPIVSVLNCSGVTVTGAVIANTAASGVFATLPYTGGNAQAYNSQLINSTGVTGLVASLTSGSLTNGMGGNLTFVISGTSNIGGIASFALNFGGQTCSFSINVSAPAAVSAISNCSFASAGTLTEQVVGSGVTQTVEYSGGNGGAYGVLVFPSSGVAGLTATAVAGNLAEGTGTVVFTIVGTPATMGTATFNITIGGASCSFSRSISPAPLPGNMTLGPIDPYKIVSAYDQDYFPYTAPLAAASLSTAAADGVNESYTIDVQGTLTTVGVTSISIPYTVLGLPVVLPAFSQTITVPASYTQDGISRAITFSYPGATLPVGNSTITGVLKSVGGTLNVKKLDVQTGLGSDYLGWLLGQFNYATNSSGGVANFDVRAISGIPDRNIAQADHRMLYEVIKSVSGKIWLNNNLGADYSNIAKASFNPVQQAVAFNDYNAYGSHYQWGRFSDGHELINWTSPTSGTQVNGCTPTKSSGDSPGHSLFINGMDEWRSTPNDLLWQGESGTNNPCPQGFRVPTDGEISTEFGAYTMDRSIHKLVGAGFSSGFAFANYSYDVGSFGYWWSSTVSVPDSVFYLFGSAVNERRSVSRDKGHSVRCIQN